MRHPGGHTRWIALPATAIAIGSLALYASAGVSADTARHAIATRVTVTLTDSKLTVHPSGLEAGTTTFVVVNKGKRQHFLAIAGPGLKRAETSGIAPGRRAKLTVKLRSGAYMMTLSDPNGLGMSATHWLQVIPHAVVSATGASSVVQPPPGPIDPICGGVMP